MLSGQLVKAYLQFLLRHRLAIAIVLGLSTLAFSAYTPRIFTNFFDLYPPRHPYIQLYNQYRGMFGTANTLLMVLEVDQGTIFDDPETIRKVDRITLALLHEIPGVNGEQVLSITHPKLKTTLTSGSGIKAVPLTYPRLPENREDLQFFKQKVYATEGVKGFFVSEDDTATLIKAGFWEEHYDLIGMWRRIQQIVAAEEDDNTRIYVTGIPILFAYFHEAMEMMVPVLVATAAAMVVLLWAYFHSLQGVVIPLCSGLMSAIWGLGFAGLCGFNIDPLVLVVPVLITARALSHSVQSMERYHEEYRRTGDRADAIARSYTELFPPAMVAVVSDGLAVLTIAVASIPIMQKLAYVASFWIISIFLSVVTMHPIMLSYARPPDADDSRRALGGGLALALVAAGLAAWFTLGTPLQHLQQIADLRAWLAAPTVAVLMGTMVVAAFFFVRQGTERVTAGFSVAAADRWLTRFHRAVVWIAATGVALCVWNGTLGVAWTRNPRLVGLAVLAACVLLLWRRLGWNAERAYLEVAAGLVWLTRGAMRYVVLGAAAVVLLAGYGLGRQLKVGDTTPGAALLYPDHPYNVAFDTVNDKFVGASRLVIIAEGNEPEAIKRAATLRHLDLFGRHMAQGEGAGGSLTATTLLKKVFRTFHEGDPKWEILPTRDDHVSQLFFLLTSATRRGEMDRFFDETYTNATIAVFYKHYNNTIIHDAIARAKTYIDSRTSDRDPVRYRLAGGLLGILAAVNEEVEWSYRVNVTLIFLVVLILSTATYWGPRGACVLGLLGGAAFVWWQTPWLLAVTDSVPSLHTGLRSLAHVRALAPAANPALFAFIAYASWHWRWMLGPLIVMAPSLIAQPLSEAVMYVVGIDFNISSLPVAAVGIGIGIDYGYYVLSRIKEEYAVDGDHEAASHRALETTGKAVLFTGVTLVASVFFWLFFPMKFQAQMALLLVMLLVFHVIGALVVIPAMVSVLRPRFDVRCVADARHPSGVGVEPVG
jgi:predicted RND superfamily exporter protein